MRAAFHRALWRRLPRKARRTALFAATRLAAPRRDPAASPTESIIVVGCFRAATGLGEAARLCYAGLRAGGFDARGIDVTAALRQPVDVSDFARLDGRSAEGPGTLLLHVNAPLVPLALMAVRRGVVRRKWRSAIGPGNCRRFRPIGTTDFRSCTRFGFPAALPAKRSESARTISAFASCPIPPPRDLRRMNRRGRGRPIGYSPSLRCSIWGRVSRARILWLPLRPFAWPSATIPRRE